MRTTLERMKAVVETMSPTNREAMLEKLADLDAEHAKSPWPAAARSTSTGTTTAAS